MSRLWDVQFSEECYEHRCPFRKVPKMSIDICAATGDECAATGDECDAAYEEFIKNGRRWGDMKGGNE